MSARTEPRFTRDVDIAVLVESDGAAEQLVRSLTADGYGLSARSLSALLDEYLDDAGTA